MYTHICINNPADKNNQRISNRQKSVAEKTALQRKNSYLQIEKKEKGEWVVSSS